VSGWRLLLTRPEEESRALIARFADAGIFASSMPLLEIEPIVVDEIEAEKLARLHTYCAVIVVSKSAARFALPLIDPRNPLFAEQPWFSVGAGTGTLLRERGLAASWPLDGEDSEALLEMPALRKAIRQPGAKVLILRGEGGRELLADQLQRRGIEVDYLQLYRRRLPAYVSGALHERIQGERLNGIVVSSGQGFEHLRLLAGDAWPAIAPLALFVPGARVAQMARAAGAQHVVECRGANGAAVLTLLRSSPAPQAMPDR